jgi:hypothetical protein
METGLLLTDALREFGWATRDPVGFDIAEANLLCAAELPGAEGLDLNAQLLRLDEIAADVERIIFLKENFDQFLNNPGKFHNSQAYFCVVCMVSILKTKYGIGYNPKWKHVTPETGIDDDFGLDAKDQFIHAILDGIGGTCGSLPVFFVAIGRRIGMPLKLSRLSGTCLCDGTTPKGFGILLTVRRIRVRVKCSTSKRRGRTFTGCRTKNTGIAGRTRFRRSTSKPASTSSR